MGPVAARDPSAVRLGRARGRYFRENFAQGGVDLVQVIPELVTNADAAIAASGRPVGRIVLALAAPDPEFLAVWRGRGGAFGAPARACGGREGRCGGRGCARWAHRRCCRGAMSCVARMTAKASTRR